MNLMIARCLWLAPHLKWYVSLSSLSCQVLDKDVHAIHTCATMAGVVVVFTNGDFAYYVAHDDSSLHLSHSTAISMQGCRVVYSNIVKHGDANVLVVVHKHEDDVVCNVYGVDDCNFNCITTTTVPVTGECRTACADGAGKLCVLCTLPWCC